MLRVNLENGKISPSPITRGDSRFERQIKRWGSEAQRRDALHKQISYQLESRFAATTERKKKQLSQQVQEMQRKRVLRQHEVSAVLTVHKEKEEQHLHLLQQKIEKKLLVAERRKMAQEEALKVSHQRKYIVHTHLQDPRKVRHPY
jgi:hypothetical protein